MQRLMRAAIGTNNIDNCSRVCHSPTSYALRKALGLSGATGSFDDIDHAGAAILIGANPTEGHPVVGARIKQATLRGHEARDDRSAADRAGRLRRAAPRAAARHERRRDAGARARRWSATASSTMTSSPRAPRASTRSQALLAGVRPRRGRGDHAASRPPTSRPPRTSTARPRTPAISWGLGVTEHKYGSEVVQLICNLALMTGKIGRPGSALLPLRGQNNVQGSSDMGALPDTYTAYRSVERRGRRALVRGRVGRAALARRRATRSRRCSTRPSTGDLQGDVHLRRGRRPDRPGHRARRARARVARVPRLPGHLRDRDDEVRGRDPAGVVVPGEGGDVHERRAAHPARRAGDRPAGRGAHRLRDPHGGLRALWATSCRGRRHPTRWTRSPRSRPTAPASSYERLGRRGLQWPVAPDGTDAPILYEREFTRRERQRPLRRAPLQGARRRSRRRVPADPRHRPPPAALQRRHDDAPHGEPRADRRATVLEIHPDDAARLWIADGRPHLGAQPRRPDRAARARDRPHRAGPRLHGVPLPRDRARTCSIGASADVNTSCPEYKVVAVDVRPIGEQPAKVPALA